MLKIVTVKRLNHVARDLHDVFLADLVACLILLEQHTVARNLKKSPHMLPVSPNSILFKITEKLALRRCVFFNKDQPRLLTDFVTIQAVSFGFFQENNNVFVCEVAQNPLDPDCVITILKTELLQSLFVKFTIPW